MRFITKPIAWALIACLVNNPIFAFYLVTGLIFFKPLPAFAEEFLDSASEGQILGTDLMTGYSIPDVNATTGQMTLTNGLVAGQTVQQGELFQEIQPGSMDDFAASYGDSAALGTHVNNSLGSLTTGTSSHAYAYQTLMGANTAMPNLLNDPIWKTSDDVFSLKSPLINDLFNGCDKKTNFSETSCPIHLEDLKSCKKTLKTESCKVNRMITPRPVPSLSFVNQTVQYDGVAGDPAFAGTFMEITPYMNSITVGSIYGFDRSGGCHSTTYTMTIHVDDVTRLESAYLKSVTSDGDVTVWIDGTMIYTSGSGCPNMDEWSAAYNIDVLSFLTNGDHIITVFTRQDDDSSARARVGFEINKKGDIEESFQDFPAGCRQRMFANWPPSGTAPPFVSDGSLNDQASTDWWKCTDASNSRTFGGVTITPEAQVINLQPILPDPPPSPPAPICYSAETRTPGHIVLECFTDYEGYEVCPEYDYNLEEHDSCADLAANPQCAYIGESCAAGAENPVTGVCQEFIVTYDCGTDHQASCDLVNDGEKTICDSPIRCMGGECIDQKTESNKDFIRAATALQTLNQTQQSNGCDPSTGDCALFAGEPMECQMADLSVLGSVDCCNMPIEGIWIDYMWMARNTWELADTSVEMYSIAEYGAEITDISGAWTLVTDNTVLGTPFGTIADGWTAVTDTFSSMADSVASMLGEGVTDTLSMLSLDAIKQQAVQWMGEWVASVFGETAASTLLTATSSTVGSVTTTTYSMAGSMLSSIITVVGIIYAIYQIAKMVVQLIFACTEEEVKLNMLKQQRLCTAPEEIGTYCSTSILGACVARKEAYCCFSSPFSRIFQQQARPQLGKTFGDPKEPTCEGLRISEISQLDFDKMNFGEWIDMLKISNQLPKDSLTADSMYDKANVTKGKLPNTAIDNAQDRVNKQTEGSNIDGIRQYFLDNL